MISKIMSFIVGAVMFWLVFTLLRKFDVKRREALKKAALFGVITGLFRYFAPILPAVISVVLVVAVFLMMYWLAVIWHEEGSDFNELVYAIAIDILLVLVGSSLAARILDVTSIKWICGLVKVLPGAGFLLSVGYFIFDMVAFGDWADVQIAKLEKKGKPDKVKELKKSIGRWLDA